MLECSGLCRGWGKQARRLRPPAPPNPAQHRQQSISRSRTPGAWDGEREVVTRQPAGDDGGQPGTKPPCVGAPVRCTAGCLLMAGSCWQGPPPLPTAARTRLLPGDPRPHAGLGEGRAMSSAWAERLPSVTTSGDTIAHAGAETLPRQARQWGAVRPLR